mmetsp:Transcript_2990/g.8904  ORF Transcript_2990/g.8904 Transcript_2990/m.8904 type:complete len:230 (+) Transcript_2990:1151-1840(+)
MTLRGSYVDCASSYISSASSYQSDATISYIRFPSPAVTPVARSTSPGVENAGHDDRGFTKIPGLSACRTIRPRAASLLTRRDAPASSASATPPPCCCSTSRATSAPKIRFSSTDGSNARRSISNGDGSRGEAPARSVNSTPNSAKISSISSSRFASLTTGARGVADGDGEDDEDDEEERSSSSAASARNAFTGSRLEERDDGDDDDGDGDACSSSIIIRTCLPARPAIA